MRIMVVDDSAAMRMIVVRTMKKAGFRNHDYCEAENGVDALAKIKSDTPDLVLSDWNMPEMNGIDVLDALRRAGSTIPFGFVTSEGSPEMRARAEQTGALFLIAKPFTPESFESALSPVIG